MQVVGDEPPAAEQIRDRHDRLLARLRSIAAENGHPPERLRIVAVTKTWPIEVLREAVAAGLSRFGESRVQEAEPKVAALPAAEWHFIGRLQSNKARRAMRLFGVIHSVDSPELLERLDAVGLEEGVRRLVLLQVNVTGEPAKAGMAPADVLRTGLGRALGELHGVEVVGLMTMGRMGADEMEARTAFAAARQVRDRLREASGLELPELSMGMTADAEAAAAEGATLVRIGTALFGPRP